MTRGKIIYIDKDENDQDIDFSNAGKLYDYLVAEAK